tara:strand:+ start:55759 stop:55974 length:216 start_codon:yes stop_codon:yes gene_type:complete
MCAIALSPMIIRTFKMAEPVELKVASKESVAYLLAKEIIQLKPCDPNFRKEFLDLYAECLKAAKGHRKASE